MTEENLLEFVSLSFINEEFFAESVSPRQLDLLLEQGWRHFGTQFFRYSFGFYRNEIRHVTPLRIRLSDFRLSKSHRRILRINSDLKTVIGPVKLSDEKNELFEIHKQRFDHGIPDSIHDFLSEEPATVPCKALEVSVFRGDKLVAASFFDVGDRSTSGIYAMFDPEENRRSLGVYTLICEIERSIELGKTFYYLGYAYNGPSFYDYKKRFRPFEQYDWKGNWTAEE